MGASTRGRRCSFAACAAAPAGTDDGASASGRVRRLPVRRNRRQVPRHAANAAARTDTFLGARYRRIVKRRGHAKALVAVARSILVIAWHLINEPEASYQELGSDWHQRHLIPARKTRDLVRQLQALGHQVTLKPTAA
ncbi:hypothetical protein ACFV2U_36935 [Streptomyces sp. NPDC059697]|uniref:hypothetical protein n=1 Tax=Streptomyces sp. NPDC059697 TaxID=3346912 RepID=UPI00368E0D57